MSLNSVRSKLTSFGLTLALVLGVVSPVFVAQEAKAASGLNIYWKNESGSTTSISKGTAFTSSTCATSTNNINFAWGTGSPSGCNSDGFTSYATGYIIWPSSNPVTFYGQSDDGFYMTVDGSAVIDNWIEQGASGSTSAGPFNATSSSITKTAGVYYPIKVWHHENSGGADWRLYWSYDGGTTKSVIPLSSFSTTIASHTVTYSGNSNTGGSIPSAGSGSNNTTFTVSANTGSLVRTGYTFSGWNTAADGNGTNYTAGTGTFTITSDVTLYAKWTINSHTITYNGNSNTGGSAPTSGTGNYNTTFTVTTNSGSLVRTGYTFGGWNTAADGNGTNYTAGTGTFTVAGDVTLYAKWNINSYTITYTGNSNTSGSVPTSGSGNYNTTFTVTTNSGSLVRTGYTFDGWNTAADGTGTSYTAGTGTFIVTGDVTLYAKWSSPGHSVSLNSNYGGSPSATTQSYTDASTFQLPSLTRTGYSQSDWNTAADGSGLNVGAPGSTYSPQVSSSLILKYEANNSGSYPGSGTTLNDLAGLINSTFSGSNVTATISGSPVFSTSSGGYIPLRRASSQYFVTSSLQSRIDNPTTGNRKLSSFLWIKPQGDGVVLSEIGQATPNSGWHDSQIEIVGGSIRFNMWQSGGYDVAYINGGALTTGSWYYVGFTYSGSQLVAYVNGSQVGSSTITRNKPTSLYYAVGAADFTSLGDGGYGNFDFGSLHVYNTNLTSTQVAQNYQATCKRFDSACTQQTIYAQWTANSYTVTYNYNGATGGNSTTSASYTFGGTALTLPTPVKTGYTFAGWFSDSGLTQSAGNAGASYTANSTLTLYASWTANTNNAISYDNQSATTAQSGGSTNYTTGSAITSIPTTAPLKSGYTFAGWYTASSGGTQVTDGSYTPPSPYGSITLYAQWTANTNNAITYDNQSATTAQSGGSTTYTTGSAITSIPTTAPLKSGYTFSGWFTSASGGTKVTNGSYTPPSPYGSITLFAQWTANTNNAITYNNQGATSAQSGGSTTYTTGSAIATMPSSPSKTGFSFSGWYTSAIGGTKVTNGSYTPPSPYGSITLYAQWGCSVSADTTSAPGYTLYQFTTIGTCNWTVPDGVTSVEVLAIGGGGGGGGGYNNNHGGGGGGAGGYFSSTVTVTSGPHTIVVGAGGSGGAAGAGVGGGRGTFGDPSKIIDASGTAIADVTGGGGGGSFYAAPLTGGGSGGGGAVSNNTNNYNLGANGTAGQGNKGGNGSTVTFGWNGGGGGGAGGAGTNGDDAQVCAAGGLGSSSSITGSAVTRAVGGAGGNSKGGTCSAPNAGGANTGSGGRGGNTGASGYAGGSGIVIIRYTNTYTVTYNYNGADGGNSIATSTFTGGDSAITLPIPTKTGFTFGGWYVASDFSGSSLGSSYSPTQSVTINAKWKKNITVTAANQNKIYTGSALTISNSVSLTSGTLVGSDAISTSSGTYTYVGINGTTYASSTTAPVAIGTYSITPSAISFSAGAAADYEITYVAGTLTINYTACNVTWTSSGGYSYAKFTNTSPCSWTNDKSSTKFEVVIVGGGGGGGFGSNGGGGGAGEVLQTNTPVTINSSQVVHVIIGAGGASGAGPTATATNASSYGSEWRVGGNGTASSFGSTSANGGGGGGGNTNSYGQSGGSGGGGAYPSVIRTGGNTNKQTISGWDSFGSNGASSVTYYGGGGGGAGGAGSGRTGGASKTIWGYTLAAGGGGWGGSSGDATVGGNGRTGTSGYPYAGTSPNWTSPGFANTGTGGGGGAPGGSGVVIIRYLETVTITPTTSAASMNFGAASGYPTAGYTTSPSVTLTSEPTCNFYASSDSSFATPITLSSTTPVGSYVVKCTGGAYTTTGASIAYGSNATFTVISNTQAALTLTSTSGTYGSTVALSASGGSGSGAVTYAVTSAGSAGCSISSTTLSATSAGTCTVTVTKAADSTYAAISSSATTVTFAQAAQTITFTKPADRKIGSGNFTVSPSASSSLSVTVTSTTTDKCTISGTTVTLVAIGTCTLRSSQAGDTNYSAATAVDQSFAISAMTVTFYANYTGASPTSSTQTIATKDATALTSNSFTRVGYTFNGWNTAALGGGTSYANSQSVAITDDLAVYAQWSAATITVTYKKGTNGNGSDIVDSFVYGNSLSLKDASAALTRTGYAISGWSTTDSSTASITHALSLSYSDATNLILYPVWSATTYTVTYKAGTGASGSDILQSWSYPGPVTLKSAADASTLTKSNYYISGWSTTDGGAKTNDLSGAYSTAGNLILYAVWSPSVYTITYSAATATSGSAAEATKSYTYGASGIMLSLVGSMVKTGHDFAGWSTTSGGAANATTPYTTSSDITLYAAWTPTTYQVIYDSNGGTSVSNGTFAYGGTTNAPTAPTRSGYTFNGWFEASSGGTALVFPYSPSGAANKTLYAQWSPISYTVTYALNGGSGTTPTETNKNITNTFTTAAGTGLTKTGYDFAGWNDGTNSYAAGSTYTVGASNLVLTAQWAKQTYTITYDSNGGSNSASRTSDTYLYGSAAINLPTVGTLVKTGYTFGGWSETNNGSALSGAYTPTQTRTLYAVWNANTYTITYNSNGGGTAPNSSSYTTGGSTVTLPDGTGMSKTGYDFSGWSTTASGSTISNSGYTTAANVTLYAIWTIKTITVTYAAGTVGGSASGVTMPASTSGTFGSSITVSSTVDSFASNGSYAFAGWSDGSNIYAKGDSLRLSDTNITLTAQWIALYAVRYSATGGTFAAGNDTYDSECVADATDKKCSASQTITANSAPSRTGYTFAGWKDQSGNNISSASNGWTISNSSYLAFATWTPVAYTVTYDSDGGSTAPTESNQNIGSIITVKSAVTKTGYSFVGWRIGGVTYGPGATIQIGSSNVTFTAIWSAIDYNLSYDLNGGTSAVPASSTKTYQQSITTPGAPERSGYNFANWSDGTTAVNHSSSYSMPANDVVLTAHWTAIDRTVTYDSNSGSAAPASLSGKHIGDTFTVGAAVTRTNYRFIGWSDASNTYLPGQTYTIGNADVTLTAVWSGQLYSVTYANGGGTGTLPTEGTHENLEIFTVASGASLSRAGYTFSKWNNGSSDFNPGDTYTMGSGAVTLTAQWSKNSITVTFKANYTGSTSADTTQSFNADTDTPLTANAFTRTDYTFAGWNSKADGTGTSYTDTETVNFLSNKILFAKWSPSFTVQFESEGGSSVSSLTYTGSPLAKPSDPTKNGYNFGGWKKDSQNINWQYSPSQSVTLRAQWAAGVNTVTFNANHGASPATATQGGVTTDVPTALNSPFGRTNYALAGWAETANGVKAYDPGANITLQGNKTLYALWTATGYAVTYDKNHAKATAAKSAENFAIGGSALKLPSASRPGFHFDGWFDAASGGNKLGDADSDYSPSSDKTIYAQWTQLSLYGVPTGSLTNLGTVNASSSGSRSLAATEGASSVNVSIPSGALPDGTVVSAKLVGDFSRANSLISDPNNFILSMVVSWLTSDGEVPDTDASKPLTMTITNPLIKAGATIYTILGTTVTVLGRATVDGSATLNLYSDPEIVIGATAPDAPTTVTATGGADAQSVVSWTAPTSNGGSAITGYTVTSSPGGKTCSTSGATPATTCTITGLSNGTSYTFTVTATNLIGTSSASSPSASITPAGTSGITVSTSATGTYGTAQTITATITGTEGTVNFKADGTSITGCATVSSSAGSATCTWTPESVNSSVSITAVLTPTSGSVTGSTSSAVTVNVGQRAITIKAANKSAAYSGSSVSVSNSYSITSGSLYGTDTLSGLTYTYTNSGVYNSTTAPTESGAYTITPSSATFSSGSSSNYSITYTTGTLTISANALTVTFGAAPSNVKLGSGSYSVSATSNPTVGSIVFGSNTTAVCTVDPTMGTLTILTSGTCTVTADNSGDANHSAATQDLQSFSVAPIIITFDGNYSGATTTTQSITTLNATALISNSLSRSGFTFKDWNSLADGTGTTYANSASVSFTADTTLYATWTEAPASNNNSNNNNSAPDPAPSPTTPSRPVVPAVPEVVTPAAPVIKAADGTSVTENYSNTFTLIDGVAKQEKLTVVETTKVVTETLGIKLELQILNQEFKPLPVTSDVKLTLEHSGIAQFSGDGFKPTTTVKVWLFSDPIFLGEYPVDKNGKFNASFLVLDHLPVGDHLLQINGVTGDSKVFSQSIPVVVKGIDATIPVNPVDPTTPVEEKPVTPTVPSTKNPLVSIYFKNTSATVDSVIQNNFKKWSSKIKGAKTITCIAYKVSSKYADKLLKARATNVCNYLKRNFGGVVKIAVLPISKASTKSNFNSKTRNGRVDIFVVR